MKTAPDNMRLLIAPKYPPKLPQSLLFELNPLWNSHKYKRKNRIKVITQQMKMVLGFITPIPLPSTPIYSSPHRVACNWQQEICKDAKVLMYVNSLARQEF